MNFFLFKINKARSVLLASLLCFCALLSGCDKAEEWVKVPFSGKTMGTTYNVVVVVPTDMRAAQRQSLQQGIDETLAAVNQAMSTYIPDSELMQLNAAPVGEELNISPELAEVLREALRTYELSQGAFDITVAPLVEVWGFGRQKREGVPADEAIAEAMASLGSNRLSLSESENTLAKQAPVQLDLSAIAKGYGADRVAEYLISQGQKNFLVEVGGELRVQGYNAKIESWRIGVEKPSLTQSGVQQALSVTNVGIATSGDYRNYFEEEGVRYSHTLDPRNGRPIRHKMASVTVIADNAMRADALATALNVLGEQEALALAEKENIAVYLLVKTDAGFEPRYSSAMKAYLPEELEN